MHANNVTGKLLIALPGLEDPNFKHSVVLVCEHSKEGAFGIIINRLLMNSFIPLLKAFDLKKTSVDMPIYFGGPVKPEQGYVIYSPFEVRYGAIKISKNLGLSASREILHDIAAGKGPGRYFFALGFAGWAAGQLEEELLADSWLVAPLRDELVFQVPVADRWKQAAAQIGVDLERFVCKGARA